jgi:hypothetical protein
MASASDEKSVGEGVAELSGVLWRLSCGHALIAIHGLFLSVAEGMHIL